MPTHERQPWQALVGQLITERAGYRCEWVDDEGRCGVVEATAHPYLPVTLSLAVTVHCDCGPTCTDEQHLLVLCPRHELHMAAIDHGRRTSGIRARLMRWAGRAA